MEYKEELLKESEAYGILEEDPLSFIGNYSIARIRIPQLLLGKIDLMLKFKKNSYEEVFQAYLEECKPILTALNQACITCPEKKEQVMKDCADILITAIAEDVEQNTKLTSKKEKTLEVDNYKKTLAIYTVPVIHELGLQEEDFIIQSIRERWMEEYPDMLFRVGTFEAINSGFRRKGFCYITTAVCETLGKPDDCYELMMFRQFRDDYLQKQHNGEQLIREYYSCAPDIVKSIDKQEQRERIYENIWNDYLKVCLKNIEEGQNQSCQENYKKMVKNLQSKFTL